MPKSKLSRQWRVIWWIEFLSGMPTPEFHLHPWRHVCLSKVKMQISHEIQQLELKYSKSNICWCKGHQCCFFLLFCHFVFGWSAKVFVNLRRSSGQSIRERSDRWPLFLVFTWCFWLYWSQYWGYSGHHGVFQGVPGVFRGRSGVF